MFVNLEMESLPVKKTKNRSINRWQIETPRPRDPLPNPVGFSNQRVATSEIQSGGSVSATLANRLLIFTICFRGDLIRDYWTNVTGTLRSKISNLYQ